MKIGFYVENSLIKDADLRYPEIGNPGVGGTQYLFVATPYYIDKYFPEFEIFIYAHHVHKLPNGLNKQQVSSIDEAANLAERDHCEFFVFPPFNKYRDTNFYRRFSKRENLRGIAWAHNTPDIFNLNELYKNKNISVFLCCSQEQYDRLRDHPIIYKSERIFNGIEVSNLKPQEDVKKNGNTVAYIGSIIPPKGFHWLAEIWPEVLKEKPNAKLIVMGSGKLYDPKSKLGKWGVAEESYERKYIRRYLSDTNGQPHSSVNFKGLVGTEKIEIMQKADIGVINPSGKTENCPGSALEFQAAATPVVSSAKRGLLDTVVHKQTGLLGNNKSDLCQNILLLLNDPNQAHLYGRNGVKFVTKKFNWRKITREWVEMFHRISDSDRKLEHIKEVEQFPDENLKWLREYIRKLKEKAGSKSVWLSLHSMIGLLKYWRQKLINHA